MREGCHYGTGGEGSECITTSWGNLLSIQLVNLSVNYKMVSPLLKWVAAILAATHFSNHYDCSMPQAANIPYAYDQASYQVASLVTKTARGFQIVHRPNILPSSEYMLEHGKCPSGLTWKTYKFDTQTMTVACVWLHICTTASCLCRVAVITCLKCYEKLLFCNLLWFWGMIAV